MTELNRSKIRFWDRLQEEQEERKRRTTTYVVPRPRVRVLRFLVALLALGGIIAGSWFAWKAYYMEVDSARAGASPFGIFGTTR